MNTSHALKTAVVTGASSGIGAATARALAKANYTVICAARRIERIEALAMEIGGRAIQCDITSSENVAQLAHLVGSRLDVLVNNAGGALGLETVAGADLAKWARMYETNVLGTVRVTQALLPALEASGDAIIINVGSTAGHSVYEGGAGYVAAKHAVATTTETMRLELCGKPIRITEIAPGMVHTAEFSLVRFDGDQTKADAVYAGVPDPLTASDIADAIAWTATRPAHVNIDLMVVKPRAQAAAHKLHRQ